CPVARDAPELRELNVEERAGGAALVAVGRLGRLEPAQRAQPNALEQRRDRRGGHIQALGDLPAGHPQPSQRLDDLDTASRGAIRNGSRGRRTIPQAELALDAVTRDPL